MAEAETTDPSTNLHKLARERLEKKRDFKTHVFIYVLVNAALVGIWAIATPDALFWPIFPILGWGIGVAANAWDVFMRKPITDAEIEREEQQLREGPAGHMGNQER
jgi:predicted membrane channel-forming protein YqfA (hemolysin III family)